MQLLAKIGCRGLGLVGFTFDRYSWLLCPVKSNFQGPGPTSASHCHHRATRHHPTISPASTLDPWESDRQWIDATSSPSPPPPHLCTQCWDLDCQRRAGKPSCQPCLQLGLILHFSSACKQGQTGSSISTWKCSFHYQLGQHYLGKGKIRDMSSWGRVTGPDGAGHPEVSLQQPWVPRAGAGLVPRNCKRFHGVIFMSCKHMTPFKNAVQILNFFFNYQNCSIFLMTLSLYHFFKGGRGGI